MKEFILKHHVFFGILGLIILNILFFLFLNYTELGKECWQDIKFAWWMLN